MRFVHLPLLVLFLLVMPSIPGQAQIRQIRHSSFAGGNVGHILKTDSFLFATTRGGIYRSSNQGLTWSFTSVVDGDSVAAVAWRILHKNNRLLAFGSREIYVSQNHGNSWQTIDIPHNDSFDIKIFEVSDAVYFVANRLFIELRPKNYQVFEQTKRIYSDDYGNTWKTHSYYRQHLEHNYFPIGGTGVFKVVDSSNTLEYSHDGLTFSPFSTQGLSVSRRMDFYGDTANLYSLLPRQLIKYDTATGVWEPLDTIHANATTYELWTHGDTLVVEMSMLQTRAHNLFTSVDNGSTWSASAFPTTRSVYLHDLTFSGGDLFIAAYGGISRSPDLGKSWYASSDGLYSKRLILRELNNQMFGVSFFTAGKIDTLTDTYHPFVVGVIDSSEVRGFEPGTEISYLWSRKSNSYHEELWKSYDNGTTWTEVTTFPDTIERYITFARDNYILYRGKYPNHQNYFSSDTGNTWEMLDTSGIAGSPVAYFVNEELYLSHYSFSTDKEYVYKFDTVVGSFMHFDPAPGHSSYLTSSLDSLFLFPSNYDAGVYDTLFIARGDTFYPIPVTGLEDLPTQIGDHIYFDSSNDSVFIFSGRNVYASAGDLRTWTKRIVDVPKGVEISSLVYNGSLPFYGTYNSGVYREMAPVSFAETPTVISQKPFPVPARTTVRLPVHEFRGQELTVTLVDVQGHILKTLHPPANPQTVQLSLKGLQPGIYFVVVTSSASQRTYKVIKQ